MRLICPNCGAQYEVDDSVIPEGGRDVQCANCGHTWFQREPHLDRELAEEMGHAFPENVDIGDEMEAVPPPSSPRRPPQQNAAADTPDAPEPRRRRGLDPEVAGILREEAAREQAVRQAERRHDHGQLETQPDLGLDDGGDGDVKPRVAPTRAHVRKVQTNRPDVPSSEDDTPDTPGARRTAERRSEQLPDIEEINSTLRPTGAKAAAEPLDDIDPDEQKKGGFRLGFFLVVLVALFGALAYLFAPQIAAAVPDAAPYLESYIAWVNETRLAVMQGLQAILGEARIFVADMVERVNGMRGSEAVE